MAGQPEQPAQGRAGGVLDAGGLSADLSPRSVLPLEVLPAAVPPPRLEGPPPMSVSRPRVKRCPLQTWCFAGSTDLPSMS